MVVTQLGRNIKKIKTIITLGPSTRSEKSLRMIKDKGVNSPIVLEKLQVRPESIVIYSGMGGGILKKPLFSIEIFFFMYILGAFLIIEEAQLSITQFWKKTLAAVLLFF